jgi:hypothetical protein
LVAGLEEVDLLSLEKASAAAPAPTAVPTPKRARCTTVGVMSQQQETVLKKEVRETGRRDVERARPDLADEKSGDREKNQGTGSESCTESIRHGLNDDEGI